MIKRSFDIVFSLFFLILLIPVFIIISIWITFDSKGPIFYRQLRVGLKRSNFHLYKFRSMKIDSDKLGLLTVGNRDPRITRSGMFIRKYKIDELPQLINVLFGDMSIVGPRPEVPKYVALYSSDQLKVLSVRPGISDFASIRYRNENEILSQAPDPEKFYVEQILPEKLKLNLDYINSQSFITDLKIILATLKVIIK
jgi:lipopolysaccharide/colanic/teichoic acid biosynthesis glycosyltransferase